MANPSGPECVSTFGPPAVALAAIRQGKLVVGAVDAPTPLTDRLQTGDEVLWIPVVSTDRGARNNRQDSTSST